MKRHMIFGACVLLVMGLSGRSWAKAPETKSDKSNAAEKKTAEPVKDAQKEGATGNFGSYQEMAAMVKLNAKQAKQLEELVQKKEAELQKWDNKNNAQIAKAEANAEKIKSEKKRQEMLKKIETFRAGRERLAEGYDQKALKILTPQQLGVWNGHLLSQVMNEEFQSEQLTEEQTAKVKEACVAVGGHFNGPDVTKSETTKNQAIKLIFQKVLTKEQKKSYEKRKMEERRAKMEEEKAKRKAGAKTDNK